DQRLKISSASAGQSLQLPTRLPNVTIPNRCKPVGQAGLQLFNLQPFNLPLYIAVDEVLKVLLPAADDLGITVLQGQSAHSLQFEASTCELLTITGVEAVVALFYQVCIISIVQNVVGYEQRSCESIHAPDVRVEDIFQVSRVATGLGVKVYASRLEAAGADDDQHSFREFQDVIGELVGVPSVLVVAPVGIDAAEQTRVRGHLQFMLEGMLCERGVVNFDIEFKVVQQIKFAKEGDDGGRIEVVLMLRRFHGLGFNEERATEALLTTIVARRTKEHCQVFLLPLHVGIQ